MALRALQSDLTWEYRSKHDPDREGPNATVFTLGSVSSRVQAIARDRATEFIPDRDDPAQTIARINGAHSQIELCKHGLRGWKNFIDESGDEIKFKTVKRHVGGRDVMLVSDECIDYLPLAVIEELAEEISNKNTLKEEEAKNSEGSPSR